MLVEPSFPRPSALGLHVAVTVLNRPGVAGGGER